MQAALGCRVLGFGHSPVEGSMKRNLPIIPYNPQGSSGVFWGPIFWILLGSGHICGCYMKRLNHSVILQTPDLDAMKPILRGAPQDRGKTLNPCQKGGYRRVREDPKSPLPLHTRVSMVRIFHIRGGGAGEVNVTCSVEGLQPPAPVI